jgi:hypothetical protein
MTTLLSFSPSNTSSPPFQSTVQLDGSGYQLSCFWNIYSQYWYYQLSQNGNAVITAPLIGSPPNFSIFLAPGIFSVSTILYRSGSGNFEINP